MQLHTLDFIIIVAYMAGVLLLGWYFSRKQKDLRDYFLSDRDVPWWAIAASIVATETSVVTFISVPAFAFAASAGVGGNFTFLQLVMGYLLGRLIIVALFIPQYFRGELFTVYQLLDRRFGGSVKRAAEILRNEKSHYDEPAEPVDIAPLAELVDEAAREGDGVAQHILSGAGRELGRLAVSVIEKLGLNSKSFRIACVGSVFRSGEFVLEPLRRAVLSVAPNAEVGPPLYSPAIGAVKLAQMQSE